MALTPASILADYSSGIGTQGATLKVDANNERVGIGTINPQGTLQVGTGVTVYGNTGIVSATNVKANTANFSGNVSVGGVLTYEDVTNVDSVGIITARAGVLVPDGQKIQLGTGDDLQIYHDATDSVIDNTTGDLYLKTTGSGDDIIIRAADDVLIQTQASEGAVIARGDGQVELYYNNSKKLETTNTGTVVTGIITATTFSGNLTGNLEGTSSIAAISSSITDTAVDVFVYDTRKDSDGGAWRKRTQHTSWYNETLNTSTRGSRKEFPAVAVIVAESNQVTIYDGDDPDLPMWMKFERDSSGSNKFLTDGRTNTAVTAVNGIIAWCDTVDAQILKFIEDAMYLYGTGGIYSPNTYIANRNNTNAVSFYIVDSSVSILDASCNDIAMTVLPNAPIDPSTGLPIPTIAVGTNSGTSVIRDDGTIGDYTGFAPTQKVEIDNEYVYAATRSGPNDYFHKSKILSSDESFNASITAGSGGFYMNSIADGGNPRFQNMTITDLTITDDHTFIRSGTKGIEIFDGNVNTLSATSAVMPFAFITSTYNTGYMVGNIKGAFLSDTTVESLTANTNLASSATQTATARLTSETYTDGATSWQMVDNAGNANGYLAITFGGLTVGQSYHLSMTVDANAALDAGYEHKIEQGSSIVYLNHWNGTGAGTLTTTFEAASGTNALYFYANGITVNVTNFNIRAVDDEDRSVNNNGLAVYGTITKSAVATGADLVAYSGWSASNNLIQPYNLGLNFGTGDFSIIAWIKKPTLTTNHYILDRNDGSTENDRLAFMINATGAMNLYFGTTNDQCNSGNSTFVGSSAWKMVMVKRINGVVTFGLDGKEYASTTTSGNWSTANLSGSGDENLFIGQYGGGAPGSVAYNVDYGIGEIALLRISASAPSAEQIKKMYEDEKVLFQENAKATLYGSSDSVTALAFDDDTNLLHVGTSGGRSDFQGLHRINNTTTAVTTAISASNDLVAEQ